MKVIIISQPKAGTYLAANLLQELGLTFSGYHISESYYQKYDLNNLTDSVKHPHRYKILSELSNSLESIADNEFSVSHLEHKQENKEILYNYKKIIVSRNYSNALESWKRFSELRSIPHYSKVKKLTEVSYNNILQWLDEPDTYSITFEDMINKNNFIVDRLQIFLFNKIIVNSQLSLEQALSKPSLTKSNIRK